MSDRAFTTSHRRILILGLLISLVSTSGAWSQNIHGIPPDVAERLPGVALLFGIGNASDSPRLIPGQQFKLGEIVARFPLEMSDGQIEQLAKHSGAARVTRISPLGLFLIEGPASVQGTEQLMERLWSMRAAVDMIPNYLGGGITANFDPDDPHYVNGNQWHIEQPSDIDLDLPEAWGEITRGSESVVVAQTDTGIRLAHSEFAGRLFVNPGEIPGNGLDDDGNGYVDDVSGWNTISIPPSNNVDDPEIGHGTWVASIMLANTDNTFQVAGVDHHAKLLPLKIINAASQPAAEIQALIAALDYLIANPGFAQIVNMSVATYSADPMLGAALTAASASHILIGASGNTGGPHACVGYPNAHPNVVTIGATDSTDALGSFSSTGTCLDFVAPGVAIYTASWANPTNPSAFHAGDGTSFSTPMISGIASLGKAVWPAMTQSDLYAALKKSAIDLGAPGKDNSFGWGRANAYLALDVIQTIFKDGFESGDIGAWN